MVHAYSVSFNIVKDMTNTCTNRIQSPLKIPLGCEKISLAHVYFTHRPKAEGISECIKNDDYEFEDWFWDTLPVCLKADMIRSTTCNAKINVIDEPSTAFRTNPSTPILLEHETISLCSPPLSGNLNASHYAINEMIQPSNQEPSVDISDLVSFSSSYSMDSSYSADCDVMNDTTVEMLASKGIKNPFEEYDSSDFQNLQIKNQQLQWFPSLAVSIRGGGSAYYRTITRNSPTSGVSRDGSCEENSNLKISRTPSESQTELQRLTRKLSDENMRLKNSQGRDVISRFDDLTMTDEYKLTTSSEESLFVADVDFDESECSDSEKIPEYDSFSEFDEFVAAEEAGLSMANMSPEKRELGFDPISNFDGFTTYTGNKFTSPSKEDEQLEDEELSNMVSGTKNDIFTTVGGSKLISHSEINSAPSIPSEKHLYSKNQEPSDLDPVSNFDRFATDNKDNLPPLSKLSANGLFKELEDSENHQLSGSNLISKLGGFATANGKKLASPSEESLLRINALFEENEHLEDHSESQELPSLAPISKLGGFKTARGGELSPPSKASLLMVNALFKESEQPESEDDKKKSLFSSKAHAIASRKFINNSAMLTPKHLSSTFSIKDCSQSVQSSAQRLGRTTLSSQKNPLISSSNKSLSKTPSTRSHFNLTSSRTLTPSTRGLRYTPFKSPLPKQLDVTNQQASKHKFL